MEYIAVRKNKQLDAPKELHRSLLAQGYDIYRTVKKNGTTKLELVELSGSSATDTAAVKAMYDEVKDEHIKLTEKYEELSKEHADLVEENNKNIDDYNTLLEKFEALNKAKGDK